MNRAKEYGIKCINNRKINTGDTVMFDIDDTLIKVKNGEPIYEIISLLHTCQMLGYKIVIITARPDSLDNRRYTDIQLMNIGIIPNILIFTSPINKVNVKLELGLTFILSVGDQTTDLSGSQYFIKLPDNSDKNVYTNIK